MKLSLSKKEISEYKEKIIYNFKKNNYIIYINSI